MATLKARVEEVLSIESLPSPAPVREGPLEIGKPRRLRRIRRGTYNLGNAGNTIALIDDNSHALLVDPGPCDYDKGRILVGWNFPVFA